MLDEEFIENLKKYPAEYLIKAIKYYRSQLSDDAEEWHESDLEYLLSAYALVSEIVEAKLIDIYLSPIDLSNNFTENCKNLNFALSEAESLLATKEAEAKFLKIKDQLKITLGTGFSYEFTDGDLKTIQSLINDLREKITSQINLEEEHRLRLLKRLEALQRELHKKISDLDRFWGLIGDAGVVLGKLGEDAKPIVDRIRDIANIVWRTQAHCEQLPSGTNAPLIKESED